MTEPAKPFFAQITLPALGVAATIRLVDVPGISQQAALDVLTGGDQADLAGDVTETLQRLSQSEAMTPAVLRQVMAAAERVNRELVQAAVVDLPGLLAAYQATGEERDMGMGPDFAALLSAIWAHNGVPEVPAQTALQGLAGMLAPDTEPKPRAARRKK